MASSSRANIPIGRILRFSAGIADRGDVNPLAGHPKFSFRAPKTAHSEQHALRRRGKRRVERPARDEVAHAMEDRRPSIGRRRLRFKKPIECGHGRLPGLVERSSGIDMGFPQIAKRSLFRERGRVEGAPTYSGG